MSKKIAVITEKGGVGKTTSVIHIGASLAKKGYKTLLIDFDAQKNLSMGYKLGEYGFTIKDFLEGKKGFKLKQPTADLYVLAGDRNIEDCHLNRFVLRDMLEVLDKHFPFDYILIDCPPRPLLKNIIGLGEIALCASDYVISPVEAEEYSIAGIKELAPSVVRIRQAYNPKLQFLGFFFNKVRTNTINFKKHLLMSENSDFFLKTYVRLDSNIERAKEQGKTIFQVDRLSRASADYISLADEIMKKIENIANI